MNFVNCQAGFVSLLTLAVDFFLVESFPTTFPIGLADCGVFRGNRKNFH
jgi:hypothetical protein